MDALKYSNYNIVFQEVPDEVALAINITGCPHKCPGCHSNYLTDYFGDNLVENLPHLLDKYGSYITCVAFMGGDQNLCDLMKALEMVKKYLLKTCIYSGLTSLDVFLPYLKNIDYLKIGPYLSDMGGLGSPTTNQKFYKIDNERLIDITPHFSSEKEKQ